MAFFYSGARLELEIGFLLRRRDLVIRVFGFSPMSHVLLLVANMEFVATICSWLINYVTLLRPFRMSVHGDIILISPCIGVGYFMSRS